MPNKQILAAKNALARHSSSIIRKYSKRPKTAFYAILEFQQHSIRTQIIFTKKRQLNDFHPKTNTKRNH